MKHSPLIAVTVAAALLAACTEPNGAPGRGIENGGALSKQDVGTAVGVVGGGVVGSLIGGGAGQVAAIVVGALLGGVLGNEIGKSMDNADMAAYDRASQNAMQTGHTRRWHNEDTGNHGVIVPRKAYTNDEGQYCRRYTQIIWVDGVKHRAHGTACRQPDGTWQIVE